MAKLAAAQVAASGNDGLADYEPPAERLAASLVEQGRTPEDRHEERRLQLLVLGDLGDHEVA